jgi:sec-independent protein translocase protein TatC
MMASSQTQQSDQPLQFMPLMSHVIELRKYLMLRILIAVLPHSLA